VADPPIVLCSRRPLPAHAGAKSDGFRLVELGEVAIAGVGSNQQMVVWFTTRHARR
jgi:hypothetical protein